MQSSVSTSIPTSTGGGHAVSEGLGLWEPKRTLTLEAARKHSARIRVLRKLLILMATALIAGVVWQFINQPRGFDLVDDPNESVRMVNPKYSGRTNDGLPYYLTASEAVRTAAASTAVNLDLPVLNFFREAGTPPSNVTAITGVYDDVDNILNLKTDVKLSTDDGYNCESSRAKIFNKDKRISGGEPISCTGSFGTVNGNSFTITEDYKVFTFADGMSAQITREAADGDTSGPSLGFGGNEPINITAKTASYKAAVTTLSGDVDVKQDSTAVTSDNMIIYRTKASGEDGSLKLGPITKIDAKGNFLYVTPDRRLSGKHGVYEREKDIITVTGNVVLNQGPGNTIQAEKLVYDMKKKNARLGETECGGTGCDDRVGFTFRPNNNR